LTEIGNVRLVAEEQEDNRSTHPTCRERDRQKTDALIQQHFGRPRFFEHKTDSPKISFPKIHGPNIMLLQSNAAPGKPSGFMFRIYRASCNRKLIFTA